MALSANTTLHHVRGEQSEFPQDAVVIYEGAMLGDNSGYARGLTAGDPFIGHAAEYYDNSGGSQGDHNITRYRGRYRLQVTLSGVAITDVGSEVYASADDTLTLIAGANSRVGIVERYVATDTAIVEFQTHEIPETVSDLTVLISDLAGIKGTSDLAVMVSDITALKSDKTVMASDITVNASHLTVTRSDLTAARSDTTVNLSDLRVAVSDAQSAASDGDWVNVSDIKVTITEVLTALSDALG